MRSICKINEENDEPLWWKQSFPDFLAWKVFPSRRVVVVRVPEKTNAFFCETQIIGPIAAKLLFDKYYKKSLGLLSVKVASVAAFGGIVCRTIFEYRRLLEVCLSKQYSRKFFFIVITKVLASLNWILRKNSNFEVSCCKVICWEVYGA